MRCPSFVRRWVTASFPTQASNATCIGTLSAVQLAAAEWLPGKITDSTAGAMVHSTCARRCAGPQAAQTAAAYALASNSQTRTLSASQSGAVHSAPPGMAPAGLVMLLAPALVAICVLLQGVTADAATMRTVTTAMQLKSAIDSGVAHVHITAHLDLSNLPLDPDSVDETPTYFWRPIALQSLTVRMIYTLLVHPAIPIRHRPQRHVWRIYGLCPHVVSCRASKSCAYSIRYGISSALLC